MGRRTILRLGHPLPKLVKDYERCAQTLADLHLIAFVCIMLKNVAKLATVLTASRPRPEHRVSFRKQAMAIHLSGRDKHRVMKAVAGKPDMAMGKELARSNGD